MDIHEYLEQKKKLYNAFIDFLDNESDDSLGNNKILVNILDDLKREKDNEEIKSFFRLIIQVSHHHHRNQYFDRKIEQILEYFTDIIQQILTYNETFNIFKSNKRILLFLFTKKIIYINEHILDYIISNGAYRHFFYPEVKPHIKEEERKKDDKYFFSTEFNLKRQKGENDSYICELIRNDSIEDFISHVNRKNLNLSNYVIKPSIFEMNPLLNSKQSTLIEYAAFFGSIQIFNYIKMKEVSLKPSLWIYAIHSNNPELIQILDDEKVELPIGSYETCLAEAIMCHNNETANYFEEIYFTENITSKLSDKLLETVFRYYNYSFFPENFNDKSIFFYLCKYEYHKMVDFLIQSMKNDFESKMIFFLYNNNVYKLFFFNVIPNIF